MVDGPRTKSRIERATGTGVGVGIGVGVAVGVGVGVAVGVGAGAEHAAATTRVRRTMAAIVAVRQEEKLLVEKN